MSTLNPSYLKAVLGEAKPRSVDADAAAEKTAPPDFIPAVPVLAEALPTEPPGSAESVGLAANWPPPLGDAAPADAQALSLALIADKKAELAAVRASLARLAAARDGGGDPVAGQAELNELRLRRLAIQMALIADSTEYTDDDLLVLDRRIAEQNRRIAQARLAGAAGGDLDAQIAQCRSEEEALALAVWRLSVEHNRQVAAAKAEAYLQALRGAQRLRHELLALAALDADGGAWADLDLGGELPVPSGFGVFAALQPGELAVSAAAVEAAKAGLRPQLAL